MSKFILPIAAAGMASALFAPAASAHAALGPDAAACSAGANRPALLVSVNGFKNRAGRLRVQVYGSNPSEFLAKGKKLRRIDLPVSGTGPMNVCDALPRPGTYAVAVRHDADGNNKSGWNDGGGFSNNPKISLMDLKPSLKETAISVSNGVKPVRVVLNYRRGLAIGPVAR